MKKAGKKKIKNFNEDHIHFFVPSGCYLFTASFMGHICFFERR